MLIVESQYLDHDFVIMPKKSKPRSKGSREPVMDPGLLDRLIFARQEIVRRHRRARMTDSEIAEALEPEWGSRPSGPSVNQIFSGMQKNITASQGVAIARTAGLTVGWLLNNEGEPPPGYVPPNAGVIVEQVTSERVGGKGAEVKKRGRAS